MIRLEMKNCNMTLTEKRQQNRQQKEAAKISALWSWKIEECEYLTGKEILPSDQSRMIEQAKFTYSPFDKAFEKQNWGSKKKANKSTWRSWKTVSQI